MKIKFCQVGMGADDTQFASAFPSTEEALVKELGQQPSNLESKNKEARLNQNSKNSHKPPSSELFKKVIRF